jgi:RNA recognition motif-containing protein
MGNRLYVGNLAFSTTEDALKDAFAEFGDVVDVKLMLERETGRSRGFAFVELGTPQAAQAAIEQMNGAVIDGRALKVNEAEDRPARSSNGGFGGRGRGGGGGGDRRKRW